MYEYILKLSEVAMAYPKVKFWPTIYLARDSTRQAILKLQQPQGYGNTPGVPCNFDSLLMTLGLNMRVKNMPTTFAKSWDNIMKYQKIERETNFHSLTCNGIMPSSTMTSLAASQYKDILINYFSYLATSAWPRLRYCPTSITRFSMEPKYIYCPTSIARFSMEPKYNFPQRS